MRDIAKSRLSALATVHGDCIQRVTAWRMSARKAQSHDPSEVHQTVRQADVVGH
jgi:hypothetical protein